MVALSSVGGANDPSIVTKIRLRHPCETERAKQTNPLPPSNHLSLDCLVKLFLGDFLRACKIERHQVQSDDGKDVAMGCLIGRRVRHEIRLLAVGFHVVPRCGGEAGSVGAVLFLNIADSRVPASRGDVVEDAMVHVVGVRSVKILTNQSVGPVMVQVPVRPGKTGETASIIRVSGVLLTQDGAMGTNVVGLKFDVALNTSECRAQKDLLAVIVANKGGHCANPSPAEFGKTISLPLLVRHDGSQGEL